MYFKFCMTEAPTVVAHYDEPVFVVGRMSYGKENLNSKIKKLCVEEERASVWHSFSCSSFPDVCAAADSGEPRCAGLENNHCAHRLVQHSKVGGARLLGRPYFIFSIFSAMFMCLCVERGKKKPCTLLWARAHSCGSCEAVRKQTGTNPWHYHN